MTRTLGLPLLLLAWLPACGGNPPTAGAGIKDRDNDGFNEDEDCDDQDGDINPDADELCDGIDNDCDEEIDEGDAVDAASWYTDADGDGFGDPGSAITACEQPSDAVDDGTDCDDSDETVNPDGTEECNDGLDNDCDESLNDCVLDAEIELSSAEVRLLGEEEGDEAGYSLATLDLNGDSISDLIVGAPGIDASEDEIDLGGAYVLLGPLSGTIGLSAADASWVGTNAEDRAGRTVAAAGDINNDNLPDVLFGTADARYEGSPLGLAYLAMGPATGGSAFADADAIFYGEAADSGAGYSVTGLGDISNDGVDDIAIAAHRAEDLDGVVYLLNGPLEGEISLAAANATLTGESQSQAGTTLDSAGDVNGDGVADILVGAPQASTSAGFVGTAYVMHGPAAGDIDLSLADGRIRGTTDGDSVGSSVAGVGDIDGDGLDDVLIGAALDDTNGSDAGGSFLFLGPAEGATTTSEAHARLVGEHSDSAAGGAGAGGLDLDNDGQADLLIGAPRTNYDSRNGAGAAYAVFGPVSGLVALSAADVMLGGAAIQDNAGFSVELATDLTGDGLPDLIVGAPAVGDSSETGSVFIVESQGY